jgi:hypothetical protein
VIGLNLCPFAKAVHSRRQIRWVLSTAHDAEALLADLLAEMRLLAVADPQQIDTTLIVHPHALQDFGHFNAFLEVADAALEELDLHGVLQVASFHPQYRFAGTRKADVSNNTNRSPYPTCTCCAKTALLARWLHSPKPRPSTSATLQRFRSWAEPAGQT